MSAHLKLVTDAPVIPASLSPAEQWLYTAVMYLLEEQSRLKSKVADLEGRTPV